MGMGFGVSIAKVLRGRNETKLDFSEGLERGIDIY